MKLSDSYDVICAGGGLSSYLSAALLSRAGKRVLVIDDESRALPRICEDGYPFDPDFSIFSGLEETAALGEMLTGLGLSLDDFFSLESIVQVLTPEYRIVFSSDTEKTCRDLKREIKVAGDGVCDFFTQLYRAGKEVPGFIEGVPTPAQGTAKEVSAWKKFWGSYYSPMTRAKPLPLESVLKEKDAEVCAHLGSAILGLLSFATPTNLGFEQAVRGLSLALRGQYFYMGGLELLKRRLAEIIESSNGNVKRGAEVESLIADGDKIGGVLLSSYEGIIRSNIVVLGSKLRRLYTTLPKELQSPVLIRALGRVIPSHWRFTVSLTVKSEVIPIGMTSNMVYVVSHRDLLEEENFLRIVTLPDGMYGSKKAETKTLLLTALVPYRASSMDYAYLRQLGGKMLRSLSSLMPFLEENIVAIHPDFRSNENELREFYPFKGSEWVPQNLMQYYIRGHKGAQDFWGPSWTTPHPNLYFAGRAVWPSLGVYGEALAARKIYQDITLSMMGSFESD